MNTTELSFDLNRDLRAFSKWMENEKLEYKSKDGISFKVKSLEQLTIPKFKEPKRNKLSAYLKALSKEYVFQMDGKEVKNLDKFFKKYKESAILVDNDIDTSCTGYLITLDCDKDSLEKTFGNPMVNTNAKDKWTTEWKILVNGHPYSIYDWKTGAGWHLAGEKNVKKDLMMIKKYIKQPIKANPIENELKKQMEEDLEKEMNEMENEFDAGLDLDDILFDDGDDNEDVEEDC